MYPDAVKFHVYTVGHFSDLRLGRCFWGLWPPPELYWLTSSSLGGVLLHSTWFCTASWFCSTSWFCSALFWFWFSVSSSLWEELESVCPVAFLCCLVGLTAFSEAFLFRLLWRGFLTVLAVFSTWKDNRVRSEGHWIREKKMGYCWKGRLHEKGSGLRRGFVPGRERVGFLGERESMKKTAWVGSSYVATTSRSEVIGSLIHPPPFGSWGFSIHICIRL